MSQNLPDLLLINNYPTGIECCDFGYGNVQLLTEKGAILFTKEHLFALDSLMNKVKRFTPQSVEDLKFIVSCNKPGATSYDGRFPENGKVIKINEGGFGILLSNRGMRLDINHRVRSVCNFNGTVIHEMGHGLQIDNRSPIGLLKNTDLAMKLFNDWCNTYGWNSTLYNQEKAKTMGWYRTVNGWSNGSETAVREWICFKPEYCIDPYQLVHPAEQICDSLVCLVMESDEMPDCAKTLDSKLGEVSSLDL